MFNSRSTHKDFLTQLARHSLVDPKFRMMFMSQGTSCIGCNHRTFGAQWSGCAPQRSLAKQTLVDQPAAHVRRFVELPKVSFQAQGFYSPQKLSKTDAMDVMEAYMASAMAEMQVKWRNQMKSLGRNTSCVIRNGKKTCWIHLWFKSSPCFTAFLSMIFFSEVTSLVPNPLAKKCIVNSRWLGTVLAFKQKAAKRPKQRGRQDPNSDEEHRDFVLFWKQLMMIEHI